MGYDLDTEERVNIQVPSTTPLLSISIRDNFLSARTEHKVFIINLKSNIYYGSYPSELMSNGLSPDGSDLVTLDPANHSQLVVYKICSGLAKFYATVSN